MMSSSESKYILSFLKASCIAMILSSKVLRFMSFFLCLNNHKLTYEKLYFL